MNVSFLYYMSQEKSHKKSFTVAYGKVEKTLKTDPYLKRKNIKK